MNHYSKIQKRLIVFLSTLVVLVACAPNAEDILKKAYQKCQSIDNGYYEMTKWFKLMSHDTIHVSQKTYFKKRSGDSIYSYVFSSSLRNAEFGEINLLYTGEHIVYYTDSKGGILSKVNHTADIKNIFRKNPSFTSYLPITYISSKPIPNSSALASGDVSVRLFGEETINQTPCFHIDVTLSPNRDDSNLKQFVVGLAYSYWISKQDYMPIQFTVAKRLLLNNDTVSEFEKYRLDKYELNTLSDENRFTLESLPSNLELKEPISYLSKEEPLEIGDSAPDWKLQSTKGETVSLSSLRGKLILVDFFYTSCPPCIEILPTLQTLHEKYESRGLKVIGINTVPIDTKQELNSFATKYKISYPILSANREVGDSYKVRAYPATYLIGKDGKILFRHVGGYSNATELELEEIIRKYLPSK